MAIRSVELVLGLAIVLVALHDAFTTVVVPGRSQSWLRAALRMRQLSAPVWLKVIRRRKGRSRRLPNAFAPFLLVSATLTWVGLLFLGFGLMAHGLRTFYRPVIGTFLEALYVAGSAVVTLGMSETDALGPARWLTLGAGLSGLGVITAAVTFILSVQSALHQRETGVLALASVAGAPATGIAILESYALIGCRDELPEFFRFWRLWCAAVLHSHVAYPILAYFGSVDPESEWTCALTAVLDAATILECLTEDELKGPAMLLHRAGSRTAAHIASVYQLSPKPQEIDPDTIDVLCGRLRAVGYPAVAPSHHAQARFAALRADYAGRLAALAEHMGADLTPLLLQRD